MPVTSCHDILVTPHEEFCGYTFVFRQVSVEVIDGVKGIVFVFSVMRRGESGGIYQAFYDDNGGITRESMDKFCIFSVLVLKRSK